VAFYRRRRFSKAPGRYSRRRFSRRRRYSRRRFRGAASNLRRGGRLGIETKYVEGAVSAAAVVPVTDAAGLADQTTRRDIGGANTAATGNLWIIAQGDGATQRDGQKCVITKMIVRGFVFFPHAYDVGVTTTQNLATPVHIFIVLDTQSNGAGIAASDVFSFPTTNGTTPISAAGALLNVPALLNRNMTWGKRFVVLKHFVLRKPHVLSDTTGASLGVDSSPAGVVPFKWVKKCRMMCTYAPTNTDGQMAGIQDNSVHVLAMTGDTTGTQPTFTYTSRVRFRG